MPRTMQQTKITFVIRDDLMAQASPRKRSRTLTMAELIRRAIDLYLTQFPPPDVLRPDRGLSSPTASCSAPTRTATTRTNKKHPIHINDGLLGELDRYALLLGQSPDEVVNRALVLYAACLTNGGWRRRRSTCPQIPRLSTTPLLLQ